MVLIKTLITRQLTTGLTYTKSKVLRELIIVLARIKRLTRTEKSAGIAIIEKGALSVEYRLHVQPQFLVPMGYFLLLFVSPILGVVALVTDVVEFPRGFFP